MSIKKLLVGSGAITGYIIGLIGTVITILGVSGTVEIAWRIIVLIGVGLLLLIVMAIRAFWIGKKLAEEGIKYPINSVDEEDGKVIFTTDFSRILKIDSIVNFYIMKDGQSKLMGFGLISNYVNDDREKYSQMVVVKAKETYLKEYESAKALNKKVLDKMYISPMIKKESVIEYSKYLKEES